MIFFYKQNAKWNANLDSLSSLGPQELFKYLGQLNPCVERSAIKNLSSINTFKSLKNVENCLWRRAHKGNCQFSWAWEKLHFLSRICRSVLSSSGYEGVTKPHENRSINLIYLQKPGWLFLLLLQTIQADVLRKARVTVKEGTQRNELILDLVSGLSCTVLFNNELRLFNY